MRAVRVTALGGPESVEIAVDDAADPHPYWLVGTRQPQQLLAALSSGRPRSEQQASDE